MTALRAITAIALAAGALVVTGGRSFAQEADDHPLARIKKHEQQLEKKIETERDRPDKKQHAKKVVDQAEENIRGLGEQIKGAGHEIGSTVKRDQTPASHPDRGSSSATPKKRARASGASPPSSATTSAAGSAGASSAGAAHGAGGASGAPPRP